MKTILVLVAVASLSGCAADRYRDTPSARLCMDYLTAPAINLNRSAREAELRRRGENCSAYATIAAQRPVYVAPVAPAYVPVYTPPQQGPINCTSTRSGQHVFTNCY